MFSNKYKIFIETTLLYIQVMEPALESQGTAIMRKTNRALRLTVPSLGLVTSDSGDEKAIILHKKKFVIYLMLYTSEENQIQHV